MKTFIIVFIVILSLNISAQNRIKDFLHFNIQDSVNNIDFIVYSQDFKAKKPILLFCQGSQPIPLFLKYGKDTIGIALSNFDLQYMSKYYNIVVISKPFTPLIADTADINHSFCYVTNKYNDEHSYDTLYLKSDTRDNYSRRANSVWQFLKTKDWVDNTKFIVCGHSQGAREALEIAKNNKYVSILGLFGYSTEGRFASQLKQIRADANRGKIAWDKADTLTSNLLEFYKKTLVSYEQLENPMLYSWKSFNEPNLQHILSLDIPIYNAYGSNDLGASDCDMLPFHFARTGKRNLTQKRYADLDHNFFPLDTNNRIDHKNGKWKIAMNEFIDWTLDKIKP